MYIHFDGITAVGRVVGIEHPYLPRLREVDGVGAAIIFQRVVVHIFDSYHTPVFGHDSGRDLGGVHSVRQRVGIVDEPFGLINAEGVRTAGMHSVLGHGFPIGQCRHPVVFERAQRESRDRRVVIIRGLLVIVVQARRQREEGCKHEGERC